MATWKGKTRGGVLGYRVMIFFIRLLNIRLVYVILRFVAAYFIFTAPKAVKTQYRFLRKRIRLPFFKSLTGIYKNFFLFAQTITDKISSMTTSAPEFTYDLDGEHYLKDMVNMGQGGLLISAHVGNWEMAGQLLTRLQTRVNIVMHDAEHRNIKNLLDSVMIKKKINIIVIKNDLSHIIKISNAIRNNEFVCIHADRYLPGAKTLLRQFFGKPARFPVGPFQIAIKFNVPLSIVFAMKERSTHYHFYATKPIITDKSIATDKELENFLDKYTENLEHIIKKYPYQWFNYFDFWS